MGEHTLLRISLFNVPEPFIKHVLIDGNSKMKAVVITTESLMHLPHKKFLPDSYFEDIFNDGHPFEFTNDKLQTKITPYKWSFTYSKSSGFLEIQMARRRQ